ncbi:MAG: LPXTG cell wall anchor domain-containing protein [Actinomycetota bacterium]|nr:LPXTG cell wall anchor domain-containing protein [Actinomycetota bacterium]
MSKNVQRTYMGRTLTIAVLAIAACLLWATAAHAQTPFDAQYDPPTQTNDPPGNPPPSECDNGDDGGAAPGGEDRECGSQVLSDTEGPIDALPTTGGLLAAPVLLGTAMIVAAGIVMVRRKR